MLSIQNGTLAISIHAPAKGATSLHQSCILYLLTISIHAPAKGATQSVANSLGQIIFQSTLPRRERPARLTVILPAVRHFNPRSREGSDQPAFRFKPFSRSFQSTLPRRERPASRSHPGMFAVFQSTLPRRERHCCYWLISGLYHFNPRSREGSDLIQPPAPEVTRAISIHAPAKGATLQVFQFTAERCISIHAPAKGATLCGDILRLLVGISIHAPAKGATRRPLLSS